MNLVEESVYVTGWFEFLKNALNVEIKSPWVTPSYKFLETVLK